MQDNTPQDGQAQSGAVATPVQPMGVGSTQTDSPALSLSVDAPDSGEAPPTAPAHDPYLEQKFFPTAAGAPDPAVTWSQRVHYLLGGGMANDDTVIQSVKGMVQETVAGQAKADMLNGTMDEAKLSKYREEYQEPTYKAAMQELFRRSGGSVDWDDTKLYGYNPGKAAKDKAELESIFDKFQWQFATNKKSNLADKVVTDAEDLTESLVMPTYYQTLANAVSTVFPDLSLKDRTQMGTTMAEVGKRIKAMDQSDRVKVVSHLLSEFKDRAGDLGENKVIMGQMADQLQAAVLEEPSRATEILDNLGTVLDVLPVVGSLWKQGGKLLSKVALPRLARGTPASVANATKQGAENLAKMYTSSDPVGNLAKAGTTPEQVFGENIAPKLKGLDDINPTSPYIEDSYLTPNQIKTIVANKQAEVAATVGTRLKDSTVSVEDGILKVDTLLGHTNGAGFQTQRQAEFYGKKLFEDGAHEVVEHQGQWFIKTQEKEILDFEIAGKAGVDVEQLKSTGLGYAIKSWFGKATVFGEELQNATTRAAMKTSREAQTTKEILEPYTKLYGDKQKKVMDLALETEAHNKRFSPEELRLKGVQDQDVIDGYSALVAHAEHDWAIRNMDAYVKAKGAGWRSASHNGDTLLLEPSTINRKGKVLDLDSGTVHDTTTVTRDTHDVFRIVDPQEGVMTAIARKGSEAVKDLPKAVVAKNEGRLFGRQYSASHIVKREAGTLPDGTPYYESVATAQSSKAAEEWIKLHKELKPDEVYTYKMAGEIEDGFVGSAAELRNLETQGLLSTSRRKQFALPDVSGYNNLKGFNDSLQATAASAANKVGMGRWADVAVAQFNHTFGEKFGNFNSFHKPASLLSKDKAAYEQAYAMWSYINKINGTHPTDLAKTVGGFRSYIGDFLLNKADKVGKVPYLGGIARFFGKEVAGVTSKSVAGLKTAGFVAWLATNPGRQLLMQTSMIPTYFAMRGGAKYALTGQFAKDFLLLSSKHAGATEQELSGIAKALGHTPEEAKQIVDAWDRSGLRSAATNHQFTLGQLSVNQFDQKGLAGNALGKVIAGLKRIGFDAAVLVDKKSSFLVAMNEFKTVNKRLPRTNKEWDSVTGKAERLSLNQNASDPTTPTTGLLSIYFQFKSQQLKMAGRLLGLEKGVDTRTKLGLMVSGLLFFGAEGYGAGKVASLILDQMGVKEEEYPELTDALLEGIHGTLITKAFQELDGEAGRKTRLASSSTFSPVNGGILGITPDSIMGLFDGTFSLGSRMQQSLLDDAPVFGLANSVKDSVVFASRVAGVNGVPDDEKTLVAAAKFAQTFSVFSNGFKAMLGARTMQMVDSNGNPVVDATMGELWAKGLFGVKSKSEVELTRAVEAYKGEFSGLGGQAGINKEISNNAKAYAKEVLIPLLNKMGREVTPQEIEEIVMGHNTMIQLGLTRAQATQYFDVISQALADSKITKSDQFKEAVMKDIIGGRVTDGARLRAIIRTLPANNEEKQRMLDALDNSTRMFDNAENLFKE